MPLFVSVDCKTEYTDLAQLHSDGDSGSLTRLPTESRDSMAVTSPITD